MDDKRREHMRSYLGKMVDVVIDRPLGSVHPQHADVQYAVNYGCLPNVAGGDGEEQDVYLLGVEVPVAHAMAKIIAVIFRENDTEDKLVAAPLGKHFSLSEIREATAFQEQYFDIEIETI